MIGSTLEDMRAIKCLPVRRPPYWRTLEYCRHIGVQHFPEGNFQWMGRVRTTRGSYKQFRIGPVRFNSHAGLSYGEALQILKTKLSDPDIASVAAQPISYYPILMDKL